MIRYFKHKSRQLLVLYKVYMHEAKENEEYQCEWTMVEKPFNSRETCCWYRGTVDLSLVELIPITDGEALRLLSGEGV